MAATFPDQMYVDVEFTAGVWTDISAYCDFSQPFTIHHGRDTPFGQPQPGTLSGLVLDNTDGRFTPERQTLADGTTVHPYYPNVKPRKRIRVSTIVGGLTYYDFTGYISGWPPELLDTRRPRVTIQATTGDDRLSRVEMVAPLFKVTKGLGPVRYWPMGDRSPGPCVDRSGNHGPPLQSDGTGPHMGWQDAEKPDGSEHGTIRMNSTASGIGRYLQCGNPMRDTSTGSLMVWFRADDDTTGISETIVYAPVDPQRVFLIDQTTGYLWYAAITGAVYYTGSTAYNDNEWHCLVYVSTGGKLYIDGAQVATGVDGGGNFITDISSNGLMLGDITGGGAHFLGNLGHVALFDYALTAGEVSDLWDAGIAYAGETTSDRVKRFLGYAGLTAADWRVGTSDVVCGSYPQTGVSIAQGCQDAAETEGGGAAFYYEVDGQVRFQTRNYREPDAPILTLDAAADLDGTQFQPAYDDTTIVNEVQGTRADARSGGEPQIVDDGPSQTAYGITSQAFTSYAADDDDVLHNAEQRLAAQKSPAFRINRLTVDMYTATTAGLWTAMWQMEIGDRIRLTNLYIAAAPATQLDLLIEGWTKTISDVSYQIVFDTSSADAPARMVWDDTTYGRWAMNGQTLTSTITNSGTTVSVTTSAGNPTMTNTGARYPLKVAIGKEHVTLAANPGGTTSPQSYTGSTRAADGTTAAAQTAGTSIQLAIPPTWTL